MKKILLSILCVVLFPLSAVGATVDYFLKIDGVEGESSAESSATPTRVAPTSTSTEEEKKGNVETEWKVEEGESVAGGEKGGTEDINIGVGELENTGVEPDEIDVAVDASLTPDFSILLGGESDSDDEESRAQVEEILFSGLEAESVPVDSVSFNYGKVSIEVEQTVKLFGIFEMTAPAKVDIEHEGEVTVKFPWWAAFASGKDSDSVKSRVLLALSSIIENDRIALETALQVENQ